MAPGRSGALARLPVRAGRRRRRRHGDRAARAARPAAPRRVRLAGAGHARRAHHRLCCGRCPRRSAATSCPPRTGRRSSPRSSTARDPSPTTELPPASLRDALAARIQRVANQPVTAADFELERVPDHLQVSFRAVDERGRAVGTGPRPGRSAGAALRPCPGIRRARRLTAAPPASPSDRLATADRRARRPRRRLQPRIRVRRAHRPHRLGLRRPARRRRHEGRRRRRARLPGARRRGHRASRCGSRRPPRPPSARRAPACAACCSCSPSPSPASYVLEHLTSAEKLALAASPYPSARALVEDAASRSRMPSSPAPRDPRHRSAPARTSSACATRSRRAVVDETLPDRVARRPHPHRCPRGRPRAARAELADAARGAERRARAGRRPRLPRLRVAHGPRPARAPAPLPAGRARARAKGSPTTPAAIGSG